MGGEEQAQTAETARVAPKRGCEVYVVDGKRYFHKPREEVAMERLQPGSL